MAIFDSGLSGLGYITNPFSRGSGQYFSGGGCCSFNSETYFLKNPEFY
jgi:hypothetical protein